MILDGMIGTDLVQRLVQSVALSHLIAGRSRAGLLLLAEPESGKTTIACSSSATHVAPVAVITGKSVLEKMRDEKVEFLLFNDMAAIRALSKQTAAMLIVILNQVTGGEHGEASFAGLSSYQINRPVGVIGCLPFKTFMDKRSLWRDLGFISRMIPFAYSYNAELVATIKNSIDKQLPQTVALRKMPATDRAIIQHQVTMKPAYTRSVRALADAKAIQLGQIGIRLLKNYHVIIRAHALLHKRRAVTTDDLDFLRAVDNYVSITECKPL